LGVPCPGDGGADVDVEEVGEDRRGQLGGEGDQCCAAGVAGVGEAVVAEGAVDDVAGGPAGEAAGEQPVRARPVAAADDGDRAGVVALAEQEGGDGGWEEEPVPPEPEEGPCAVGVDLVGA
jgi:hypothetical protein